MHPVTRQKLKAWDAFYDHTEHVTRLQVTQSFSEHSEAEQQLLNAIHELYALNINQIAYLAHAIEAAYKIGRQRQAEQQ